VGFSRRSLLVVVSFVVVAAVAVVCSRCHCRPVGGGIAWFACGDGVLLSVGGWGGGGGEGERGGGVQGGRLVLPWPAASTPPNAQQLG
jgi:hypothetical protein